MIPKKTSSIQLKTQVMISPIFVTGNIVEYVEREKIDLIVRNKRKIGYQENFIRKYCSGVVIMHIVL